MSIITKILAALVLLVAASSASAIVITYEGTLAPHGVAGIDTVPTLSGWVESAGSEVDFWRFSGQAGWELSFVATTTDPDLELALSLYQGTTSALEFEFLNASDFGGLSFLAAASAGGPGGSAALLDFVLPASGPYTLAVGGNTPPFLADPTATGPFAYQIAVLPLPPILWLFIPALLGMMGLRPDFVA